MGAKLHHYFLPRKNLSTLFLLFYKQATSILFLAI
uniref:Uncharacterized protein n=1 Tax=Podoviridae sp. ct8Lf7 TaxID=2827723 RepID=A0A8S5S090_9CAUD|nr:MAG TPA: hypothetical protein [Podoviridae sp. ct8Lf7]